LNGSTSETIAEPPGSVGEQVWLTFAASPPQVSPDGQWLILYNGRGNWQLLDLAQGVVKDVGQGQPRLSPTWAPDSQSFAYLADNQLCIYQLESEANSCLFSGENLLGVSWSPNGQEVAVAQADFTSACCVGEIWIIHTADGSANMISTYSSPPEATTNQLFEWTAEGDSLLVEGDTSFLYSSIDETIMALQETAVDISPDGQLVLYQGGYVASLDGTIDYPLPINPVCPAFKVGIHHWDWSPAGDRLAYLSSCSSDEAVSNWLYVLDAQTGEIIWQKEITGIEAQYPLEFLYWSPDGEYLFLDEPDEIYDSHPLSPIWRIKSDGTGTAEIVVEEGFLIGVVPQWMK
jgi:WD40 repeat protein